MRRSTTGLSARRTGYASQQKKGRTYAQAAARSRNLRLSGYPRLSGATQWTLQAKIEPAANAIMTSTSGAPGFYSFTFRVQDLPDFTSYSAIWDEYRINKIVAIITPLTQAGNPATAPGYGPLVTAMDFDDGLTPTSFGQVLQYANSMIHPNDGKQVFRTFTPKYRLAAYNGTTTINSSLSTNFIDLAAGDIEHYSLKCAVRQATSTNVQSYHVIFKYVVTFRKSR